MAALTPDIRAARRLVVKIGSALLVDRTRGLRAEWLRALALGWVVAQQGDWGAWQVLFNHPRVPFAVAMFAEGAMGIVFARNARAGGAADPWRALPAAAAVAAFASTVPLLFLSPYFGPNDASVIAAPWMVAQALLAWQAWRLVRRIRGMEGR